jgi:hypothetical protein
VYPSGSYVALRTKMYGAASKIMALIILSVALSGSRQDCPACENFTYARGARTSKE